MNPLPGLKPREWVHFIGKKPLQYLHPGVIFLMGSFDNFESL
jgi:hypothetical protein